MSWINYNNSLKRIWLLRHCDKPKDPYNPCCSHKGYERSNQWATYFNKYLNPKHYIKLYSSNFNENKICLAKNDTNHIPIPDNQCQKSQRMFLTASSIYNNLSLLLNISPQINSNYCIGESSMLMKSVVKNTEFTDILIIWEHHEIIDIIREFNIEIPSWKNKLNKNYDIVFLIDVINKKLYYECYDFLNNLIECTSEANDWLYKYNSISNYFNKNNDDDNNNNLYQMSKPNAKAFTFGSILLLSIALLLILSLLIRYAIIKKRRLHYVVII